MSNEIRRKPKMTKAGRTQEGVSNCTTTQFAVFFNKNKTKKNNNNIDKYQCLDVNEINDDYNNDDDNVLAY